jgi:6,7-dimethyl-8-ribityllumazine synthase
MEHIGKSLKSFPADAATRAVFSKLRVGIVCAYFHELITSQLKAGALKVLHESGVLEENILCEDVPGSFELPLAAQWLLDQGVDGVIALGCVIQGGTDHYDYVCSGVTSGLMTLQQATKRPVGFGVLTCQTVEQALERAGGKVGNKGADTAQAVLEMLHLEHRLLQRP